MNPHGIPVSAVRLLVVLSLLLCHQNVNAYSKNKVPIHNNADVLSDTHDAVNIPGDKKLYFFAGPHKSASTSVEKFFANRAVDGFESNHPHTIA